MTPIRFTHVAIATVLVPLALAGCGGGGSDGDGGDVESAADAAEVIGCSSSTKHETEELYVTDAAACSIDGADVTVFYFSTNEARDSYIDAAAAFGGQYLVGDQFAVDAEPEVLDTLEGKVDGTSIRP
jgi:hypothetical protein